VVPSVVSIHCPAESAGAFDSSVISAFISAGAIQLFVGPASASSTEQMKVLLSTRATSVGSDAPQNEFGLMSGLSWTRVPRATSSLVSACHSASEPSHQWTPSGCVSSATSLTQASSLACEVGAVVSGAAVAASAVMPGFPLAHRGGGRRHLPLSRAEIVDMGRPRSLSVEDSDHRTPGGYHARTGLL